MYASRMNPFMASAARPNKSTGEIKTRPNGVRNGMQKMCECRL